MHDLGHSVNNGLQIAIAGELVVAVEPLLLGLRTPQRARALFRFLGFQPLAEIEGLRAASGQFTTAVQTLVDTLNVPDGTSADALLALIDPIWSVVEGLPSTMTVKIPTGAPSEWADEFAQAVARIPSFLLVRYLDRRAPWASNALRAVDAIRPDPHTPVEEFSMDRLSDFLSNPSAHLASVYQFESGTSAWRHHAFLAIVDRLSHSLGARPHWGDIPPSWIDADFIGAQHPSIDAIRTLAFPLVTLPTVGGGPIQRAGILLSPIPTGANGPVDGLFIAPFSDLDISEVLVGDWRIEQPIDLGYPAAGVAIHPDRIQARGALPDVRFGLTRTAPLVVGDPANPDIRSDFAATLQMDSNTGTTRIEAGTGPNGLVFRVDLGGADGFVRDIAGPGFEVAFDLTGVWDSVTGFDIDFAALLELYVPVRSPMGPVSLDGLYVRGQFGMQTNDGRIVLDGPWIALSVRLRVTLGIVTFSLDELGVRATVVTGQRGVFGNAGLELSFEPPKGIGIEVGTPDSPISGGGFLKFEPEQGRYSGALELDVSVFRLSVLGLLTTPTAANPDQPWSLLLVVNANFGPVPLGFGFVLSGIGGALAIQRTLDLDTLEAAFPTGGLEALLFPDNPVANAPVLLDQLDSYFPIERGRVAGGLFVELGWGPPGLLTLQLGVLLGMPSPFVFALIGKAELLLPPVRDAAVVQIRLDLLGLIRPDVPEFSLQAQLVDSRIGPLKINGGAILLARFGDDPAFLLSLGGFHPSFVPPHGVVAPPRIGLSMNLGAVDFALETYFAVTSNTLQLGAVVRLSADIAVLRVYGELGFDVLVVFRPFGFRADVWAMVSITTRRGREICGVSVEATLTGPGLWTFNATLQARLFGLEVTERIQGSFGEAADLDDVPPIVLEDKVAQAFVEPDAVSVSPVSRSVPLSEHSGMVLGPKDQLVVQQREAPLGVTLHHHHHVELVGGDVTLALVPPSNCTATRLTDQFAMGSHQRLTERQRLERPGFEPQQSGIGLTYDGQLAGAEQELESTMWTGVFLDGTGEAIPPISAPLRRAG